MKKIKKILIPMLILLLLIEGYFIYSYRAEAKRNFQSSLDTKISLKEIEEELSNKEQALEEQKILNDVHQGQLTELEKNIKKLELKLNEKERVINTLVSEMKDKKANNFSEEEKNNIEEGIAEEDVEEQGSKEVEEEISEETSKESSEETNKESKIEKEVEIIEKKNQKEDTSINEEEVIKEDNQRVIKETINKMKEPTNLELYKKVEIKNNDYELGYSNNALTFFKKNNQNFYIYKILNSKEELFVIKDALGNFLGSANDITLSFNNWNEKYQLWTLENKDNKIALKMKDRYLVGDKKLPILEQEPYHWSFNDTSPLKGSFKYFAQLDNTWRLKPFSWKNLGAAGCGIFSSSMIVNNVSPMEVSPLDFYEIARENNLDIMESPRIDMLSFLNLTEKTYGFDYKKIQKNDIIQELANGNQVLVAIWPNDKINYHGNGHYFMLRGLTDEGHLIVVEPYYKGGNDYHAYDMPLEDKYVKSSNEFSFKTTPEKMFSTLREAYAIWSE